MATISFQVPPIRAFDNSSRWNRSLIRTLAPRSAWVESLAWHLPSARLSAGCFDGTVTTWNLESGTMVKQFLALPVIEQAKN